LIVSAINHHPSAIIHQPSSISHHPSAIIHHPSAIIHQPSSISHHPSAIIHQPSSISHHPSAIIHQPSSISHQPSSISYYPSAIIHQPSSISHHQPPIPSISSLSSLFPAPNVSTQPIQVSRTRNTSILYTFNPPPRRPLPLHFPHSTFHIPLSVLRLCRSVGKSQGLLAWLAQHHPAAQLEVPSV